MSDIPNESTPSDCIDLIWLLEDDDRQAASLEQHLIEHHTNLSKANLIRIPTESEFLVKLKEVFEDKTARRPRLVIADVMLPWAFLGKEPAGVDRPTEVNTTHGFRTAGARCWEALRNKERAAQVNRALFIFHTVLRRDEFNFSHRYSDEKTAYIAKDQPFALVDEEISDVIGGREEWDEANWQESEEAVSRELLANPQLKEILLEGRRAPLDRCVLYT